MNKTLEKIGVIPAAGKGARLGLPYPKELYPVIRNNSYEPVAQSILGNIVLAGVGHIVFVINDTKHQLIAYFGDGNRHGCNISYVVQETPKPSKSANHGLAQAMDSAYHLAKGRNVFFGMPDTIIQPETIFRDAFESSGQEDVIMISFKTDTPQNFSMVKLDGDVITEVVGKPIKTDLIWMWGCIIWNESFSEYLHKSILSGEDDISIIFNSAIRNGLKFKIHRVEDGRYLDLGTGEGIVKAQDNVWTAIK